MNLFFRIILLFLLITQESVVNAQPANVSSSDIRLLLKKLNTLGSVLYVAAHPDDENTRLLSYLDNERHFRTVYISITRGDGGQNLIGGEQGEELGMIRTKELMAARAVDGAEQFFTRANDFGFSKNPEETFKIWGKEDILADVVWAIRKFRPDVIINRFPTTGEGGHGHHTASAILAVEAFKAAADPERFPEQLKFVKPWQAKRIFHNSFVPRGQPTPDFTGQIKLDVGGYNPLMGESYGEIASKSRSMHKSQGFGVARSRGTQFEYFRKLDGDTSVTEIFENINSGWKRLEGGEKIEKILSKIVSEFSDEAPEKSLPELFSLLKEIRLIKDEYWKNVKEKEILDIITACTGLFYEATTKEYYNAPGDSVHITATVISRLTNLKLENIIFPGHDSLISKILIKNEVQNISHSFILPSKTNYSNPYWLDQPHTSGLFSITDLLQTGEPWNKDQLMVTFRLNIENQIITYTVPLQYKYTDPVKGELYRPFEIVPPVSIELPDDILIFTDNSTKSFRVKIISTTDSVKGKITFNVSKNFTVTPSFADIRIPAKGKEMSVDFKISQINGLSDFKNELLEVKFESEETVYDKKIQRIEYDHIPPLISLHKSSIKLLRMKLASPVNKIGYITGAGDDVAKSLSQAGYQVTILDEEKLMNETLSQYGAIITGIRTYNINEKMDIYYDRLMKYVEDGGTLIVQYNTNNFLSTVSKQIGPYPFKISRDRVTDETAPVTFTNREHRILNVPNKIIETDFEGWVQERGLYFATDLSKEYETPLSWNDPGEKPLSGGLIIAKKGKGNFIYTGIAFFRQLPAGVSGAYRLMSNLINASAE